MHHAACGRIQYALNKLIEKQGERSCDKAVANYIGCPTNNTKSVSQVFGSQMNLSCINNASPKQISSIGL
jgi:hypothetical protein